MEKRWERLLGELLAGIEHMDKEKIAKELADIVDHMPPQQRGSVITAYVIAKINTAENVNQILGLLDKAKEVGLLTVASDPGNNAYFKAGNLLYYVPTNPLDKRALAVLAAARKQNTRLSNTSRGEVVRPRIKKEGGKKKKK